MFETTRQEVKKQVVMTTTADSSTKSQEKLSLKATETAFKDIGDYFLDCILYSQGLVV